MICHWGGLPNHSFCIFIFGVGVGTFIISIALIANACCLLAYSICIWIKLFLLNESSTSILQSTTCISWIILNKKKRTTLRDWFKKIKWRPHTYTERSGSVELASYWLIQLFFRWQTIVTTHEYNLFHGSWVRKLSGKIIGENSTMFLDSWRSHDQFRLFERVSALWSINPWLFILSQIFVLNIRYLNMNFRSKICIF